MQRSRLAIGVSTLLLLAASCRGDEPQSQAEFATAALLDGTPEAVGVLRFLNDASTTLGVLDDDVPLPSNAAANVIAHRNASRTPTARPTWAVALWWAIRTRTGLPRRFFGLPK